MWNPLIHDQLFCKEEGQSIGWFDAEWRKAPAFDAYMNLEDELYR